jgi:uncharacterized protein
MDQKRLSSEVRLRKILYESPLINTVLTKSDELSLPGWHLCAGCLTQSVWNSIFELPSEHGIDDIDLIYFDNDNLGEATEENQAQQARTLFADLAVRLDVKNEARVHLWYEGKFGKAIPPFQSIEHAVSNFPTTATAIAVHPRPDGIVIVAPFGLDDLFDGIVRPNKTMVTQDRYEEKIERWRRFWPQLTYLPWQGSDEED